MNRPNDTAYHDRLKTYADLKNRMIFLDDLQLEVPEAGIFDEPTRCYKINKEWASLAMGMVAVLTNIAVWKDATDESFRGITEIIKFLIGGDCAGEFSESGDCFNFLPSAPFVSWFPYNPYSEPDTVPSGYVFPPFHFGGIGYQDTDVLVDLASLPIFASWLDIINGFLPQVEIKVVGDGQIELDLLAVFNGGFMIVKEDNPPNILDLLLGIIDPATTIIDTQIDIAIPGEVNQVISKEINVSPGAGVEKSIFITWIPRVDDSSIPIGFGGGIRGITLCGFESAGTVMGITNLRLNNCNLEMFLNEEWVAVPGWDTSCITDPLVDLITANTDNIASNLTAIQQNAADIALNQADIATLVSDVDDLQLSILQHQLTLNNHEQRITALENASGGVPNLQTKTIRIPVLLGQGIALLDTDDIGLSWTNVDEYDIIKIDFFGIGTGAAADLFMFVNNDLTAANYASGQVQGSSTTLVGSTTGSPRIGKVPSSAASTAGGFAPTRIEIVNAQGYGRAQALGRSSWRNGDAGNVVVDVTNWYWENTDDITEVKFTVSAGQLQAGSYFVAYGMRFLEVALPATPIQAPSSPVTVNFEGDATDYEHYTASDQNHQGGIATLLGNPGSCYFIDGELPSDINIFVDINLVEPKSITDLTVDIYSHSLTTNIVIRMYADDVLQEATLLSAQTTDTYHTYNWQTLSAFAPFEATVLRFEVDIIGAVSGGEIRVDNIIVEFDEV